jgi:hypothetical protein
MSAFDCAIEQLGRAIDARGIGDIRVVEHEHRPLFLWRQMIARECIDVC